MSPTRSPFTVLETLEDRRLMTAVIGGTESVAPADDGSITVIHTFVPRPTTASVQAAGVDLTAKAGISFSDTLGTLTNYTGKLSSLTAVISYGDNTPASKGVLTKSSDGTISVKGSHTYKSPGNFHITVTLKTPTSKIATITTHAAVTGGTRTPVTETSNKSFTAKIGTFIFPSVDLVLAGTINWGDGKQSSATLSRKDIQNWDVTGTHTYTKAGTYKVKVTVTSHLPGSSINSPQGSFTTTITVHKA